MSLWATFMRSLSCVRYDCLLTVPPRHPGIYILLAIHRSYTVLFYVAGNAEFCSWSELERSRVYMGHFVLRNTIY